MTTPEQAIGQGDNVRLIRVHHAMAGVVKDRLGKIGRVSEVDDALGCLVYFGVFGWWIKPRYLEKV